MAAIELVTGVTLAQSKQSFQVLLVDFNEYLDKKNICWVFVKLFPPKVPLL